MLVFFVDASSYDSVNPDVNDDIYTYSSLCVAEFQAPLSPKYHPSMLRSSLSFFIRPLVSSLTSWVIICVLGQVSLNPFEAGLMIHKLGMPVNPSLPALTHWYQQEPRNSNQGGQGAFGNQVSGSGLGKLNSKNLFRMEVGG